ncbi:calmodulin [Stylonychia lemnae]|uniref:Calmodulin n=1 Tax=Stylonychia lemnae TaxID=5949 RepID=A0A078AVS0_STYLE|nr:calmodulin [Stylonychia lemnae]|eukprot:CDW86279.1 calmodulin [Stylonychia lemnae]
MSEFSIPPQKTYSKEYQHVEEDDIAQIQEIFKAFDSSNRSRVPIDQLPQILRLLNKNISEKDASELQYEIDKKHRGYFTFNDLIQLLSDFQFKEDTEMDLLNALQELDQGADGFIPKETFTHFLTTMGEVFNQDELNEFMKYALDENNTDDLIDIRRLSKIMLPKIQARKELLQENLTNNIDSGKLKK